MNRNQDSYSSPSFQANDKKRRALKRAFKSE